MIGQHFYENLQTCMGTVLLFYDSGALTCTKRTQQSTMVKKIWLSVHPRNFGSDKVIHMHMSVDTSTPSC